jgi:hypothetical protein
MAGVKGRGGRQPGVPSGQCIVCQLRAQDPLRLQALEDRLALGESAVKVGRDYGVDRSRILRHWAGHCDKAAILRRVHRRDRELTPAELLEMSAVERERPLMLCRRQIGIYIEEFEKARAAGDAMARDQADRRLFSWAHLEHRILMPLVGQFGPSVTNVQNNNVVVAGAGAGFGQVFEEFERRLALHPAEKRGEVVNMLRNGSGVPEPELDADAAE